MEVKKRAGRHICLVAPKGEFRVIRVNISHEEIKEGDFVQYPHNVIRALERDFPLDTILVFDDTGTCIN